MDGYLFLDVEWADARRHICSIAYQRTNYDGVLLDSHYQLVNPLCEFDLMTQRIHGITEEMVAHEPTYGLSTCCDHYGIALNQHHDALFDTNACRELFWKLAQETEVPDPKPYVFGGGAKKGRASWR